MLGQSYPPDVLAFQRQHLHRNAPVPQWRRVFDAVNVRRDFVRHLESVDLG